MFKCLCGHEYTPVPDEEAETMPPSFRARLFRCDACKSLDWVDPTDLGIEDWEDAEE